MNVYHREQRSRGSSGSNPGWDSYVYVRPETEEEEKLLDSLRSGATHIGDGDWRLSRDRVRHVGGRPYYGGPTDAYRVLRTLFLTTHPLPRA